MLVRAESLAETSCTEVETEAGMTTSTPYGLPSVCASSQRSSVSSSSGVK